MPTEMFKTIKGIIEEKINVERSVFIATISFAENETDAREFISKISKKYQDATHNCTAYRILNISSDNVVEYYSDGKEPPGTAGLPILNTLRKNNLLNVAAVVSRYFGGVKLGVRGLIDAYSKAVQVTIDKAVETKSIQLKKRAYKQKLKIDFHSYGKKMQSLSYMGVNILDISYTEEYAYLEIICQKPVELEEVESTQVVYVEYL
ncbi:MAG: YigZ family protein [Fervidobacterium sp.]|nr:YigZ family protein [Fervidobacterium sp.]